MKDEFLPIGSVVVLNGGIKPIMITGYCMEVEDKPGELFDYRGCPYPEGILSSEGVALFNGSDISEVVFKGFLNDESTKFLETITKIIEEHKDK